MIDIDWKGIGSAAWPTVLSVVLTFFTAAFWFGREARAKKAAALALEQQRKADDLAVERQRFIDRLADQDQKIALLSASVVPISTAFQALLIKELTHAATPEMDALMAKVGPPYVLNHEEERRLVTLLCQRAELEGTLMTDSERHASQMLPWIIQRVNAETALGIPELTAAAISTGPVAEKQAEEASAIPVKVVNPKPVKVTETP